MRLEACGYREVLEGVGRLCRCCWRSDWRLVSRQILPGPNEVLWEPPQSVLHIREGVDGKVVGFPWEPDCALPQFSIPPELLTMSIVVSSKDPVQS